MSSLENTITEVISEATEPKGDGAAKVKPDEKAPEHDSKSVEKAGDATKKAKIPGGKDASEKGEELKDGETKVEKGKPVNFEEVEDLDEMPEMEMDDSKPKLMKAMVDKMKDMNKEQLKANYSKIVGEMPTEDEDGDEDKVESLSRNALIRGVVESMKDKSIKEIKKAFKEMDSMDKKKLNAMDDKDDEDDMKESKKSTKEMDDKDDEDDMKEMEDEDDEDDMKESIDMTDDIEALVSDEDLSEGFKNKAKTIFEAAVSAKVKELTAEKETQLEEELENKVEEIKDDLTEKVDSYLNYVSESWITENELAVERGLKSELTEDFINGLKKLFEEHYVEVPEDKFDVVEELANRLDEMEDKLNEEVANNITAQQDIEELQREKIISEASNDLADTQVEKLKSLSEDVDFENVENFVEKVSTLKESYFGNEKMEAVSDDSTVASSDADFSGTGDVANPVNESMSKYTTALSKFASLEK